MWGGIMVEPVQTILDNNDDTHVLLIGTTRSGKSRRVICPPSGI